MNAVDKQKVSGAHPSIWRNGPASYWYDILGVPKDATTLDYGFKLKVSSSAKRGNEEEEEEAEVNDGLDNVENLDDEIAKHFPDDVFHLVTQVPWENNIIWDGTDPKHKKSNINFSSAGWVPSGVTRKVHCFSTSNSNDYFQSSMIHSNLAQNSGSKAKLNGIYNNNSKNTDALMVLSSPNVLSTTNIFQSNGDDVEAFSGFTIFQKEGKCYSSLPVESRELAYSRWEDNIIWDAEEMDLLPQPPVTTLDPSDENMVVFIPEDIVPQRISNSTDSTAAKDTTKKGKSSKSKAATNDKAKEGTSSPVKINNTNNPFNISNDKYYEPKHTTQPAFTSGSTIRHSTPVLELVPPFIPTHIGENKLKNFHRPTLVKYKHGKLLADEDEGPPVYSLMNYIKKKENQREQKLKDEGDVFFMNKLEDLTGKDGTLLLFEYCEEYPPLLNLVGMSCKIKNYYKRKAGKQPEIKSSNGYGEMTFAHSSPFLGQMRPGETIQAIENNMYRAPIYQHAVRNTDFLLIRTRDNYFIRDINSIFTVGQECPLMEVPAPNSKMANNFVRDFLQMFIYKLFWESRDNPRKIKMDDVKKAFPSQFEGNIRKRLKQCADFKRHSNCWVLKPEFRLPDQDVIRELVTPEQCCAYFSLIAAEQRLKDAGYGERFLIEQDDEDEENQGKIDDEVKAAPWNTTRAYIQATQKGKCLLQLQGPADPTGCGEGFSYIRAPNKPQSNKEEQEAQPKRVVTGTDADLRRLSTKKAKELLRKFGVPEDEIKRLSRWELIAGVRTLSTQKAKAGEKGMTKFSRGHRFSLADHQERYKEECQRIFELQNRVLGSHEVLSTDDESSDEEEKLSDIEEMGKKIENILSDTKTASQINFEREEQERRELQQMILGDGKDGKKEDEKDTQSKKAKKKNEEVNNTLNSLASHPLLRIKRIFRSPDGKEFTRTEIVRERAIIDLYMKIRSTNDENFIRQFAHKGNVETLKKEKRRLQGQLRRIKKNQEEKDPAKEPQRNVKNPKRLKIKEIKPKPDLTVKCGACGQVGHMKTNKICPLYHKNDFPAPAVNVAMTEEQEEEYEKEMTRDDVELIKVDGTKVHLSRKILAHADNMKRRSLLLKVPKDVVVGRGQGQAESEGGDNLTGENKKKKRRLETTPHCDYLSKPFKTTNRMRVDPQIVISGIFEKILNEMKSLPDVQPFMFPVPTLPSYMSKVQYPMDLQTIKEKVRDRMYPTSSSFLDDVKLIANNSVAYNGENSLLTDTATKMYNLCRERLAENEEKLVELERQINPEVAAQKAFVEMEVQRTSTKTGEKYSNGGDSMDEGEEDGKSIKSTFSTNDDDSGFSLDVQEMDISNPEELQAFSPQFSINGSKRPSRGEEEEEWESFSEEDSPSPTGENNNGKRMRLSVETDEDDLRESNLDDHTTNAEAIEALLGSSKNAIRPKHDDDDDDSIIPRFQLKGQFPGIAGPGPSTNNTTATITFCENTKVIDSENDADNMDDDDGGLWF